MNDRLEIAALLMAGTNANPQYNQTMASSVNDALSWADALIARERETRPKGSCGAACSAKTCINYAYTYCPYCGEAKL